MAGAVMLPLAPRGGMCARSPAGRPMKEVAADFIKPNDRLTSFERLEIYNRQYWFRLKDCFYDDYPGLRALLGDRRFATPGLRLSGPPSLSILHLAQSGPPPASTFSRPSRTGSRRCAPLALDMARLEWAHIEAFDNEAKPPLEAESLLGADPARIRLRLQPHITLLHLHYELDSF